MVRRLASDPGVTALLAVPGNPGIAEHARTIDRAVTDVEGLSALARHERVDFTIVGPELPLSLGLVDRFEQDGLHVFGPTARAATLEIKIIK